MTELLRQNIRLAALIAVVLLLLVVVIVLLLQWQSAEDNRVEVEDEWKSADATLFNTRVQYDLNTLQAEENRLSAKPRFPAELPIVQLMLHVANGAPQYGVSITEVVPAAAKTQVTVTGTLTNIISFLKYIERGPFNSIKIEDVSLSGSGGSWRGKFTIVVISE
ncbi:MAG: hypothetical protein V3V32_00685 [Dehalococcoidia bacterium]